LEARQRELNGFERSFAQTQTQATGVEKTFKRLQAEHGNV